MGFWGSIFGRRTTLAPSGSLSRADLQAVGFEASIAMGSRAGFVVSTVPVVNTKSMLPTFDCNALLLVEAAPFDSLREGDLVLWQSKVQAPGKMIAHRLNERRGDAWWSLGDNNGAMDNELITPTNYYRRVCGILYGAKDADTDK